MMSTEDVEWLAMRFEGTEEVMAGYDIGRLLREILRNGYSRQQLFEILDKDGLAPRELPVDVDDLVADVEYEIRTAFSR